MADRHRARRACVNIEVDKGVKDRAMAVFERSGMTLSGAVRAMAEAGKAQRRMPFCVSRDPALAGAGMTDDEAARLGIERDGTDGRSGVAAGASVRMTPSEKEEMRAWCRSLCITPNALIHLYLGQVAFELRVPLNA